MDFIEGFLSSESFDVILVVVDRFTKYTHLLALSHRFTAQQVANLFLSSIYNLQGLPKDIVSDRDRIFISIFSSELFKKLGTQLYLSIAYHPQFNGQTEKVNQCLESYLRCMTSHRPKQWFKWLSLA